MKTTNKVMATIALVVGALIPLGFSPQANGEGFGLVENRDTLAPQPQKVTIYNQTNVPIYIDVNFPNKRFTDVRIPSGSGQQFSSSQKQALIDWDYDIQTPGIQVKTSQLTLGKTYALRLSSDRRFIRLVILN